MPTSRSVRDLLIPKPELCSALDPAAQPRLEHLHCQLASFYNSTVVRRYFALAEQANEQWSPSMKAHWHLKRTVPAGASVLDLGCGSAHALRNLGTPGMQYTGVDWSQEQIRSNGERYAEAEFVASSLYDVPFGNRRFDVVMSLYVVEHLVWPHRLLEQMYRLTRPGGLIAILTPPFRHREYLKSFDYGLSAISFNDKLARLKLLDAAVHVYQHRIAYPRVLRRRYARHSTAGRFLIHLNPVCLRGGEFFSDSDAVYLADTQEMAEHLTFQGASELVHWPDLGYLLMQTSAR